MGPGPAENYGLRGDEADVRVWSESARDQTRLDRPADSFRGEGFLRRREPPAVTPGGDGTPSRASEKA